MPNFEKFTASIRLLRCHDLGENWIQQYNWSAILLLYNELYYQKVIRQLHAILSTIFYSDGRQCICISTLKKLPGNFLHPTRLRSDKKMSDIASQKDWHWRKKTWWYWLSKSDRRYHIDLDRKLLNSQLTHRSCGIKRRAHFEVVKRRTV